MGTKIHDRQVEHRSTLPRVSDQVKPTLKELLPGVNTELTPMFELRESVTPDLTLNIGAGKITNADTGLSRTFSPIKNQFFDFTSGTITFPATSGGAITVSPAPAGFTEILTVSVGNFIAVLTQVNSLGEITVVSGIEAATAELAINSINFPVHFKTSLPIGFVIMSNVGGVIQNIVNEAVTQFEIGGGGGGSGDANSDLTRYSQRLELAPFEYANTNVADIDEDDQLDGASTADHDVASGTFKFLDSTADTLISIQQLDSDFLDEELDVPTVELYAIWQLDDIDTSATYEVSRDGGNEYQALTMDRIGNSDSYRGILNFVDEASNSFNQEYAVANADGTQGINSSTIQEISQKFTVTNTTTYKNILTYINKNQATSTGSFCVEIVKDDTGTPSLDINDSMWTSPSQNIDTLAVGNNVINVSSQFVLVAGDYHIIIKPDDAYRVAFDLDSNDNIQARLDVSSGTAPNYRSFNGTVWSSEVSNNTMVYRLEGRELDLRVKITSSATANDKFLRSYAVYYKYEDGVQFTNPVFRELFQFDGTVDNDNEFVLTNFLPDSRLLMCFAGGTGQVFRYGDFVLDGHKAVFPPNTFNVVGTVNLEFFQIGSVDGVSSSVADALLTANHLGSTDAGLDKSIAGRGNIYRNSAGALVEVGLDEFNNFTFTVVG